jgi:hypothetical protein
MPLNLIRCEARARHLAYLVERLKTCPMKLPADDGASVEDMVERAHWEQAMVGLRRGLDESERQAKVRH